MVTSREGLARRIAGGLGRDLHGFVATLRALTGSADLRPGLYTYRTPNVASAPRLHLRVHTDGSGLLIANAADVAALSPTACYMAKLTLEGTPPERALASLRVQYPDVSPIELAAGLSRVAGVVTALATPSAYCSTCELDIPRDPLFCSEPHAPYKADLALTYACNNRCAHCYNEPQRRVLPSLDRVGWQEAISRLHRAGIPYLIFTGGEPTLHPDLTALIAHAEGIGQITGLNTNGRRLAEPGFAKSLKRAGLDHLQVTLNSHLADVHDRMAGAAAYAGTVGGVRAALEAGLHVITNTTLVRTNVGDALNIVDFVHALGLRTFAMNGLIHAGCGVRYEGGLSEAELVPVLQAVRHRAAELEMRFLWYTPTRYCCLSPLELGLGPRSCNAGEYSICVEPSGDVLPCQSYYEPVGNILRHDWDSIWRSPLLTRLRQRRRTPQPQALPRQCWGCDERPICAGGCPLQRATCAPTSLETTEVTVA